MKPILASLLLISTLAGGAALAGSNTTTGGASTPKPATSTKTAGRYVYQKENGSSGKSQYHCYDTNKHKKVNDKKCSSAGAKKPQ